LGRQKNTDLGLHLQVDSGSFKNGGKKGDGGAVNMLREKRVERGGEKSK